ncbi:MAG: cohesin domain-containing protein [Bacteroidales bacterium]
MRKLYLTIILTILISHLFATEVIVNLPDTSVTVSSGTIIEIPIVVSDLSGLNVEAYQFDFNFDNNVITPEPPYIITSGTLSATPGWSVLPNANIQNKLIIGAFGYVALNGNGTLLKLKFRVLVDEGSSSLIFSSFIFNAGNPEASVVNGWFNNNYGVPQVVVSLPDISVSHAPETLIEIPVFIDGLDNIAVNSYGFELHFDPQIIVPYPPFYKTTETLSNLESWMVTVNNNSSGRIILEALGEEALNGNGILIKLIFSIVASNGQSPLYFDDFLINDGSPGVSLLPGSLENNFNYLPLVVSLPNIKVSESSGAIVNIPVEVSDLSGLSVISYEFTISFDNNIIKPEYPYFSVAESLSDLTDWFVFGNEIGNDELNIGAIGTTELEGSGTMLNLIFRVVADEGFSLLNFQSFRFNDGSPEATLLNGSFQNEPSPLITDSLIINNRIVGDGDQVCYQANKTIEVSNFTVESGGNALFFAGENILLKAGVQVLSGGYFHAVISQKRSLCSKNQSDVTIADQNNDEMIETTYSSNPYKVYPNPTSGKVIIELNNNIDRSVIQTEVYSLYGERILNKEFINSSAFNIDLSAQPSGILLLRIYYEGKYWFEKIIKY